LSISLESSTQLGLLFASNARIIIVFCALVNSSQTDRVKVKMSAPQAPAPLPMKKGIVKQVSEKNVEEIFVVILSIETVCQLNTTGRSPVGTCFFIR
jgi:hypothetical protein